MFAGGEGQPVEVLFHQAGERHAATPGDGLGPSHRLGADRKGELGLHTWKQTSYVGAVNRRVGSDGGQGEKLTADCTDGANKAGIAGREIRPPVIPR